MLLERWNGESDTGDVIQRLRRVRQATLSSIHCADRSCGFAVEARSV